MPDILHADGSILLRVRRVEPAPRAEAWDQGVIWRGVNVLEIELGDAHWYGQGALVHQRWPLERLAQHHHPFITSDNGVTGLLGILDPFWITSDGAGILVESDDFSTGFNAPLDGEPPAHSFVDPAPNDERPLPAERVPTDGLLIIRGEGLTIRFFACRDARAVVEAYWNLLTVSPPPPPELLAKPLWTTWARFKCDISDEVITGFARDILDHGFSCGLLGIDGGWPASEGDRAFNPNLFPDPEGMIAALDALGIPVTIWTAPYTSLASTSFPHGADQNYYVARTDGQPWIGRWWGGQAGFVDPTNDAAMGWYFSSYQATLVERLGLHGLKIDGGEAMFFPDGEDWHFAEPAPRNRVNHLYVRHATRHFPWSDTRSAWKNQGEPMLFRQWDKSSGWGFDNGLASCITQTLTLNLLGYPFHFADMIGGNLYGNQHVDAELMIRWTQAVAPMPVIQFSLAPWDYGEECNAICARYARLHEELAMRTYALAAQRAPIVRPLWWIAPKDPVAQTCDDAYLVGDDLLVAPVIHAGARHRDIYLPPGQWRSYWDASETHQGGAWLRDYSAPLDVLPLFERVAVTV